MDADYIPEFRRAVRGHLAERPAISQSADTIHRHLKREHTCTISDVTQALVVVEALGHLKHNFDPLGGSKKFYQITAAGLLAHERGE